jgi:hypothetical protein
MGVGVIGGLSRVVLVCCRNPRRFVLSERSARRKIVASRWFFVLLSPLEAIHWLPKLVCDRGPKPFRWCMTEVLKFLRVRGTECTHINNTFWG